MIIMSKTQLAESPPAEIKYGDLPMLIGYALRRAQLAVFEDFHRNMAAEDMRPAQFSVLLLLKHNPGLRQTQVSTALSIKTTNFVPLFDELERRGLAERRPIAGDRRAKGLFLTAEGSKTIVRLERQVAIHDAKFAARLGADGKFALIGLLHRLAEPAFDPPAA